VDDSAPQDAEQHRRNCRRFGARYLAGPAYVGAQRNAGVRQARYDLLLFTDSDCRVALGMIDRYVRSLRPAPERVAAIAGPTLVEPDDSWVSRIMTTSQLLNGDLERPRAGGVMNGPSPLTEVELSPLQGVVDLGGHRVPYLYGLDATEDICATLVATCQGRPITAVGPSTLSAAFEALAAQRDWPR
jgi:hypothetical protein